jgi:competence protein ComEC
LQNFGNIPLVRVCIPFICGISLYGAAGEIKLLLPASITFVVIFLIYTLLVMKIISIPGYSFRWISGFMIVALWLLTGYLASAFFAYQTSQKIPDVVFDAKKTLTVMGCATSEPVKKEKSVSMIIRCFAIRSDKTIISADFALLVYLPLQTKTPLSPGDTLVLNGKIQKIKNAGNPDEFDYAGFMARKGVLARMFVSEEKNCWRKSGHIGLIERMMTVSRSAIRNKVITSHLKEQNRGLALALLLGDKAFLDEEIRADFSNAGTIHVLCVSGLHAGIIFLMISSLLGWIRKAGGPGKVIFFVLALTSLWSYAMLTGLTPSVSRASLMMTFIITGQFLKRKPNTLNSIAGAALCLLIPNPGLLQDMGFSLSFLSVAGIVTLQKPLVSFWNTGNRILIYLRDMSGVSISAQAFTSPLTLPSFHTFPLWFLPANLIVIPVTGFALYGGIIFLLLPTRLLSGAGTWVFDTLLSVMRWEVEWVGKMPLAQISGIYLTRMQGMILLAMVVFITLWLNAHGRKFLIAALSSLLLFAILFMPALRWVKYSSSLTVYHLRDHTMCDFISDNQRLTVFGEVKPDAKTEKFATDGYRTRTGTLKNRMGVRIVQMKKGEILLMEGKSGRVVFLGGLPFPAQDPLQCNTAIITGQLKPDGSLFNRVKAEKWIADGSVKNFALMKWLALADSLHIRIHSTEIKGAYVQTTSFINK